MWGCATTPGPAACTIAQSDRAWIDRAIDSWHFTTREIISIGRVPDFEAIFFTADCVMRSANALSSPTSNDVTWAASPHQGNVRLPDGSEIPAGVVSYVSGEKGSRYLVMAAPSVWEAAGIIKDAASATRLIPVLLHEASHVAQIGPYGSRLGALIDRYGLPDSFDDDAVQDRFETAEDFAASVKRETELLIAAALAEDDRVARRLAREARRLMRERQGRWYVGDDVYFAEAEDIWLTFEGAGQWTGYQWLIHPRGAAQPAEEVLPQYTTGRHWSQTEGFAVVMALDRLMGPSWKRHAYGDGARTVLEMLDDTLD